MSCDHVLYTLLSVISGLVIAAIYIGFIADVD